MSSPQDKQPRPPSTHPILLYPLCFYPLINSYYLRSDWTEAQLPSSPKECQLTSQLPTVVQPTKLGPAPPPPWHFLDLWTLVSHSSPAARGSGKAACLSATLLLLTDKALLSYCLCPDTGRPRGMCLPRPFACPRIPLALGLLQRPSPALRVHYRGVWRLLHWLYHRRKFPFVISGFSYMGTLRSSPHSEMGGWLSGQMHQCQTLTVGEMQVCAGYVVYPCCQSMRISVYPQAISTPEKVQTY